MDRYLVVSVDTNMFWPTKETECVFRGHKIILRPETKELEPTIVLQYSDTLTHEDTLSLVNNFLSTLVWVKRKNARVDVITGGGQPIKVGKSNTMCKIEDFQTYYLPDPADRKSRLALALYREAMNLNSIPYRFLGFFKIINILCKDNKQKDWINANVEKIRESNAVKRITTVRLKKSQLRGRWTRFSDSIVWV